jgi:hypothetical protein
MHTDDVVMIMMMTTMKMASISKGVIQRSHKVAVGWQKNKNNNKNPRRRDDTLNNSVLRLYIFVHGPGAWESIKLGLFFPLFCRSAVFVVV